MADKVKKLNDDINHFEVIFANCTLNIIVTDNDGKIILVNPFALIEFGYESGELIGKNMEILFSTSPFPKQNSQASKKEESNKAKTKNLLASRKDGSEFPVEINLSKYIKDGNEYDISIINHISGHTKAEATIQKLHSDMEATVALRTKELKEALQELEKAQAFQNAILENAGAMIIATDEKGIIRLFNHEAAHLLGYSPREVLGKVTPEIFHSKKDLEKKRRRLLDDFSIKANTTFDVLVEKARHNIHEEEQCNYVKKTGESFPVSLTITALRNASGDITGYMGIAFDISERIKAEKKLKKTEHLFLQLLDNYPDGIISIIDQNFNFVYTGGDLHKMLHADIEMLIGHEIFPLFPIPLRKIIFPILESIFQDKIFITGFELPYSIANGTYIMDAFPLAEEDGSVNNIGVIIKNISKLKQAEKNLREDLKLEKELNELKSRFVSMASHEFRTPLSTVLSSAYLIEKYTGGDDQNKREKHVQRIVSSVNLLTDILNDFLSLGKIEEGKLQAKFSKFNLPEMVESTLDEIKNTLKKDQQITYTYDGNPTALLDPSLVKHIVMNLVSNASKFSPETSSININTSRQNGSIVLSVKDKGIGISKEDQKHLAERFFRAANAQDIQGTGLGLHIVSKYAEMMNGDLTFKSEVGIGTEFTITFKPPNEDYEKNSANRR